MDVSLLVKQCQNGDKKAFGILYQTYLPSMRKIVAYYVHSPEVVWDILHDGFLIAFDSISSLKNTSKVESWLTSIMKNLALQYLKKESTLISIPLSDISIVNNPDNDSQQSSDLSWEELIKIINQLPEGYGKVFRLAILDGMSHKEIGTLLGIAPHSSSSQLAHAKAKVRHMIIKYRTEIGIISVIAIIILVWHNIYKTQDNTATNHIISQGKENGNYVVIDTIRDKNIHLETVANRRQIIKKALPSHLQEFIANETTTKECDLILENDSVANDTTNRRVPYIFEHQELITNEDLPIKESYSGDDWSLSLAYTGNLGQSDLNRYMIPNTNDPTTNSPDGIEVTEKTRHFMPIVIGLSLNKSLTSGWSVETGLRYTYLRSESQLESRIINRESIQRIHCIGVPLKFNYRIITYNGFSLYGQGGAALDIPVYGKKHVREFSSVLHIQNYDVFHIKAPLQWSLEGGVGIQYNFTRSLGIYAEPSFRYYIKPNSDINTIRQEKPFEFTIPIGFRFTW